MGCYYKQTHYQKCLHVTHLLLCTFEQLAISKYNSRIIDGCRLSIANFLQTHHLLKLHRLPPAHLDFFSSL